MQPSSQVSSSTNYCEYITRFLSTACLGTGIGLAATTIATLTGILLATAGGLGLCGLAVYTCWKNRNITVLQTDPPPTGTTANAHRVSTQTIPTVSTTSSHTTLPPVTVLPSPSTNNTSSPPPTLSVASIRTAPPPPSTISGVISIYKTQILTIPDKNKAREEAIRLLQLWGNSTDTTSKSKFKQLLKEIYEEAIKAPPNECVEYEFGQDDIVFSELSWDIAENINRRLNNPLGHYYYNLFRAKRHLEHAKRLNATPANQSLTEANKAFHKADNLRPALYYYKKANESARSLVGEDYQWIYRQISEGCEEAIKILKPADDERSKRVLQRFELFLHGALNVTWIAPKKTELMSSAVSGDLGAMGGILELHLNNAVEETFTGVALSKYLTKTSFQDGRLICVEILEELRISEQSALTAQSRIYLEIKGQKDSTSLYHLGSSYIDSDPAKALGFLKQAADCGGIEESCTYASTSRWIEVKGVVSDQQRNEAITYYNKVLNAKSKHIYEAVIQCEAAHWLSDLYKKMGKEDLSKQYYPILLSPHLAMLKQWAKTCPQDPRDYLVDYFRDIDSPVVPVDDDIIGYMKEDVQKNLAKAGVSKILARLKQWSASGNQAARLALEELPTRIKL